MKSTLILSVTGLFVFASAAIANPPTRPLNPFDFSGLRLNAALGPDLPGDVELGGVTFRAAPFNPRNRAFGSPYLKPIYASDLFKLIPNSTLAQYAQATHQDPSSVATQRAFVDSTSTQLNQLFVLESIGGVLDNEAILKRFSSQVPLDRIDYIFKKILILDNKSVDDAILEEFVSGLVARTVTNDEANAAAKLAQMGIPQVISDLFQQRMPSDGSDPRDAIEKFKASFDAALAQIVAAGHDLPGVLAPPYAELTPALIARVRGLATQTSDTGELFNRLKDKIGTGPYVFQINWQEGREVDALKSISDRFSDSWQPMVIAGQNPSVGADDVFPQTVEDFYHYIERKLEPRVRAQVRQKMANTWLFSRNPGLLLAHPPRRATHLFQIFEPMHPMVSMMSLEELNQAYSELKYDIAAKSTRDFTIVEVKLGESGEALAAGSPTNPCVLKFNKAFEKPYTELQNTVVRSLADPSLTTRGFDDIMVRARIDIPSEAFRIGVAALRQSAECENFPASIQTINVHVDPSARNLSETDMARMRFLSILVQDERMQSMMIPKRSRRDSNGNVYHYFFQSHKMTYVPFDHDSQVSEELRAAIRDELCQEYVARTHATTCDSAGRAEVESKLDARIFSSVEHVRDDLRDGVIKRRLADKMRDAFGYYVETRYALQVRTTPFSYGGVSGFQLKAAAARPAKWLPQLFLVGRTQKNPELLIERKVIEHSSSLFERSYGI